MNKFTISIFFVLIFNSLVPSLRSGQVFAQIKIEDLKKRLITIHYEDSVVRAQILIEKKKMKPTEERLYYWYKSNKIFITKGGFDGYLLHGSYTELYKDRNLKVKGAFKNGLKHGKWMSWYENSQVRNVVYWKKGVKNGLFRYYINSGQLIKEGRYYKDKLHGKVKIYDHYDKVKILIYKKGIEKKSTEEKKSTVEKKIIET